MPTNIAPTSNARQASGVRPARSSRATRCAARRTGTDTLNAAGHAGRGTVTSARQPAGGRRYVVGIALRVAVAFPLAAIFVNTWFVAGLFQPVVVAGGSMAPALRGPHRLWTCRACGAEFACGLESLPVEDRWAVCPYCQSANDAGAGVDRPGNRVIIDRSSYLVGAPRRWDAVVLECPGSERDWCVKRIVGLPGERVAIRDGDVWIDGQVARKRTADVKRTAVLVHRQQASTGRRWRDAAGGWRATDNGFEHETLQTARPLHGLPIDWLEYHHPPRSFAAEARDGGPILDESPYNQAESRLLNPVSDVLLSCQVHCGRSGALFLRGKHGGEEFVARLDLDSNEITLQRNDKIVAVSREVDVPRRAFRLDWLLADRHVQLALDHRLAVEFGCRGAGAPPDGLPRLAIGAQGSDVSLSGVEIWRDIYYTPAEARAGREEYVLGRSEYFLMGDNSPHSLDSRSWPGRGVSAEQLIGRAVGW